MACALHRGACCTPAIWGTANLKRLGNMHIGVRDFEPSPAPAKAGILRRLLAFLAKVLASPKGDQGSWEGGARGL